MAASWQTKPVTANVVRKITRMASSGTLPMCSQPSAVPAGPSGWSASPTAPSNQCDMLAPTSSDSASAAATPSSTTVARANGQRADENSELTFGSLSVALRGLQCGKALIDPVRARHVLQLLQLRGIGIERRRDASEARLSRQHAVERRSGALDLGLS